MNLKELTAWAKGKGLTILKIQGRIRINYKGATDKTLRFASDVEETVDIAREMVSC